MLCDIGKIVNIDLIPVFIRIDYIYSVINIIPLIGKSTQSLQDTIQ